MGLPDRKLTVIAGLYVSQAVPLGFLIVALPAILRRAGLGLELTGALGALAAPWLLKFLWAPLVDRFGSRRLGHYRSWIVPLQTLIVLLVVALAGLDPARELPWLVAAAALVMLASATQDIAADGLAVRAIDESERGRANGIQVGGYYLGQVLGGGLVLVLYDRAGWTPALLAMAALLALPLLPLLGYREPEPPVRRQAPAVDFAALRRFVARPGARLWILVLLLYRTGEAAALTMFNPMLVDAGLELGAIGVTLGVAGSAGAAAGAAVGGWLVAPLGRKPSLVLFGVVQAVAVCAYLVPAAVPRPATIFAAAVIVAFAGGMATASLYTGMMDRSDPRTGATDFTLQQSICAVGPLAGASLSGVSAARLGYPAHFAVCAALALVAALLVARRLTPGHAAVRQPAPAAAEPAWLTPPARPRRRGSADRPPRRRSRASRRR